uniref:protein argonaute-2-like n=1 Tax=Styela clava TaxID=7725 RepID=UPI00193A41C1|nr:protein argonaute-2-like [Styela clava]
MSFNPTDIVGAGGIDDSRFKPWWEKRLDDSLRNKNIRAIHVDNALATPAVNSENQVPQQQDGVVGNQIPQQQDGVVENRVQQQQDGAVGNRVQQQQDGVVENQVQQQQDGAVGNRVQQQQDGAVGNRVQQQQDGVVGNRVQQQQDGVVGNRVQQQQDGAVGNRVQQQQGGVVENQVPQQQGGVVGNRVQQQQDGVVGNRVQQQQDGAVGNRVQQQQGGVVGNRVPQQQGGVVENQVPQQQGGSVGNRNQVGANVLSKQIEKKAQEAITGKDFKLAEKLDLMAEVYESLVMDKLQRPYNPIVGTMCCGPWEKFLKRINPGSKIAACYFVRCCLAGVGCFFRISRLCLVFYIVLSSVSAEFVTLPAFR